jgi:hypothetical protein
VIEGSEGDDLLSLAHEYDVDLEGECQPCSTSLCFDRVCSQNNGGAIKPHVPAVAPARDLASISLNTVARSRNAC